VKEQEKSEMEESKGEDNVEPAPQADQPDQPAADGSKEETVEAAAEAKDEAEADMPGAATAAEGEGKDVDIESDVAQGLGAANEE